jgi:hypothetical protein
VKKKYSVIENFFEIWGWRLRICKNFEITRTIWGTVKGQNNFWKQNPFLTCSWRFPRSNKLEQLECKLEKNIGIRNMQEKLENDLNTIARNLKITMHSPRQYFQNWNVLVEEISYFSQGPDPFSYFFLGRFKVASMCILHKSKDNQSFRLFLIT